MIAAAIEAMCLRVMAFVNWYPLFSGTIVSQNQDGTLEWKPDPGPGGIVFLAGQSKVPIRSPFPGFTVTVAPKGQVQPRCAIQFEQGDRKRPVAVLFEAGLGITSKVQMVANAINVGGNANPDPMLMGQQILNLLNQILAQLLIHSHIGNLGAPTPLSPADVTAFTDMQSLVTAAPPNNTLISNVGQVSHDPPT